VLPAQPVDAIGFSLGGTLVLAAAAQDPARFHRIVIGGVGASLFQRGDAEALARAVEIGSAPEDAGPEAAIFARFARAPGNDPMALAAFMRRPTERLTPAELATLSRPVLVVLGEHDFAGPAAPLLDALPDASYVEIRGLDHFGTPKDYRFIDAAVKFLETEDS
jgi:pimeloyl-ACP methyl ester carboxylesterase